MAGRVYQLMGAYSPARWVAAQTLITVSTEALSQANDVLGRQASEANLRADDARLARAMVFGVLRNALTLDHYYAPYLKQPAEKLDVRLRTLLRMATYQKYFLSKVPDYAIVNETVELGKALFKKNAPQAGFLNAVLRKIAAEDAPRELPEGNRVSALAVRYSFPQYLAGLFVEKYGTHHAAAIMEACNEEPPLTVRVNTLRTTVDELRAALEAEGFATESPVIAPEALIVQSHPEGKSLFETAMFSGGLFYVQDEGSQLIAYLVAPEAGEKILDLCSAPGGKSTHLAELGGGKVNICATDFSAERLKLLAENIERLGSPAVEVAPLEQVLEGHEQYDVVLVDAPCSGMGTIRRNPEIRYRITREELERQAERQLRVLRQAAGFVRRGGRMIYSTCSMSNIENRDVIRKFVKEHPEFSIYGKGEGDGGGGEDGATGGVAALQREDGFYATWPQLPAIDGFEAVVLLRGQ